MKQLTKMKVNGIAHNHFLMSEKEIWKVFFFFFFSFFITNKFLFYFSETFFLTVFFKDFF